MSTSVSVSVIIPCFRCVKTLERAMASVAAQTVQPAEVILVDDASGDDTRTLMKNIRARFESGWVKLVLLDKNVGAGSARNAGWAIASHPLIAFLDADDAWHSRKIEIQYSYMLANPDVVLSGHGFRVLKQDALPCWNIVKSTVMPVKKWRMILSNQFVTPSVMIRQDVAYRFIDHQRYMEDHMLWLNVVCAGERVAKLPADLTAIYKESFGVTGLSSMIWLMERGELNNYRRLYKKHYINIFQFTGLVLYSLLKYLRRFLIYVIYLRWKK